MLPEVRSLRKYVLTLVLVFVLLELVKSQHEKARKILSDNREKLDELAMFLYEKETITGEEFMEILNGKDGDKA